MVFSKTNTPALQDSFATQETETGSTDDHRSVTCGVRVGFRRLEDRLEIRVSLKHETEILIHEAEEWSLSQTIERLNEERS